jgi:hypothetical protein
VGGEPDLAQGRKEGKPPDSGGAGRRAWNDAEEGSARTGKPGRERPPEQKIARRVRMADSFGGEKAAGAGWNARSEHRGSG